MQQKVIIVGGGFGGIRTALDLAKKPGFDITLISSNENFEYYPGLHKMLGVDETVTVQVPLATIFKDKNVKIVIDTVTAINPEEKSVATTKEQFKADFLVLALGSQTEYFGIAGLPEMAYGFKSVDEAKRLRNHIEEMFAKHAKSEKTETVVGLHMVVVGAGPNGVDLAGELAALDKYLAKKYGIPESFITIDLIEAGPRVLGVMSERVSHRVEKRLRNLGVNVLCNRDLKKEDSWTVTFADMTFGTKTLIWTAGIISNELVTKIPGFILGKRNRIAVDDHLQAKKADSVFKDVFCIGDIADTQYAGLAQTALADGAYVAQTISQECNGKSSQNYSPVPVAYNIGVGPRWSVLVMGSFESFGLFAYMMRTLIDIKFFLSILPIREVYKMYIGKK
jgi:NADH dehydrogenase